MDYDPEAGPLLSGATKQRRWRAHWCLCLGDCSPEDAVSCALVHYAPCCAFGLNMHRSLQLGFWTEVFKYCFLTIVPFVLVYLAYSSMTTTCAVAIMANQVATAVQGGTSFDGLGEALVEHGVPQGKMIADAMQHEAENLTPEQLEELKGLCKAAAVRLALAGLVMLGAAVILILYAAARRSHLRSWFGIPGSFLGDCCLWTWCAPLALCQETRTLMHNQVQDGVWLGERRSAREYGAKGAAEMSAPAVRQVKK